MKKIILIFLLLLVPINFIYAKDLIPGGENIGIEINGKGVMIIGFYKVNGIYHKGDLLVGDRIIKVNDYAVNNINDLISALDNILQMNDTVKITYIRGKKELSTNIKIFEINGVYKTGLYVKDSTTGIGTLTFIDPETMMYGSLGHEIIDQNTKERIEVKTGYIFESDVLNIKKSVNGLPGGKNANFNKSVKYGTIDKNTSVGIFGKYTSTLPEKAVLSTADISEVKIGEAKILTTLDNNKIEEFTINIDSINENSKIKNYHFIITDERLLSKTGGIVQGMSGSPIIQNNKIIGAVTHVIVDNVETGYGIKIDTMLKEIPAN